jgi:hypothetical protein
VTAANGQDDRRALVAQLWEEHRRATFPARLRGEEIAGVDMVMVDADVAGCVDTWLSGSGPLDAGRLSVLRDLVRDLDGVVALLEDEHERQYYERLRDLARLVLDVGRQSRT